MNTPLTLVTGATGKTGARVVEQLTERGAPVRALVRREDQRSDRLQRLGADVVVGDLTDLRSMRGVLDGVRRIYFVYPPQGDRLVETSTIMATAARDVGVEALINMSQISAREDAKSPLARHHWLSEQIFDWADVGAVHIRPTFFAEMLHILAGASIAEEGTLALPFGEGRHAPVAANDIARVVVGLLLDPATHVGERYVVTGQQSMTMDQIAHVLQQELGRPIVYVDVPIAEWGRSATDLGMPAFLVRHLEAVALDHQHGIFDAQTDVVERIGGRAPQSLQSFIRTSRERFAAKGVPTHA